jgi:cytochrome c5
MASLAREKVMNNRAYKYWLLALIGCGLCLASYVAATGQSAPAATEPTPVRRAVNSTDPGEKVFEANCARCHIPPMTLSQRVTGAIVLHMRTRARLSRKDQRSLLQYLAP